MKKLMMIGAVIAATVAFAQEPAPVCECKEGKPCICGEGCQCGSAAPACECKGVQPCQCEGECKCPPKGPECGERKCGPRGPECGERKCGPRGPECGERKCGPRGPECGERRPCGGDDVPRFVKCNCCPECKGLILLPPRGMMRKGGFECGKKGPKHGFGPRGNFRPECGNGPCPAPEAAPAPEVPAPQEPVPAPAE